MEPQVVNRPERSRYEVLAGDDGTETAGFAEYFLSEGEIAFIHTETDPRFAGRGLGGLLAQSALDDARARGLHVLPYCPFIRGWIRKHPEYADLVLETHRPRFGL
ncbi:N-acetyltransferase [Streptomyces sp. RY43-2]|uniref:N-acetyltransferase n=1 Tax=Streptomyces macrolidinus TaxID=2952607 RepID=A0ABT0ZDL8_9ACTN|nr:GNAT family N-acetyltransferase [Streptomyces macrolidinus]MCN9241675.1 N-acetyltransferase [Streptomyces macrolidinus]